MKSQRRSALPLSLRQHNFNADSLPIDTWVKPGIYSPHLDFCPFGPVAARVANGRRGSKGFPFETLGRCRSFKQPRLCLKSAWRSDASGDLGPLAFPVRHARFDFGVRQAWESGSSLPHSRKVSDSAPDLPRLQREQRSSEEGFCDFSDIPCFMAIRHGKDFTAIRRGQ